ncbi:unnamed protein product [Ambrosiozyma monospora]|uniref:Unnamed protein product n=1 Tax=Ambrosiozyma monospora TaxID=43982 RepID=A0ACB5TTP1_AMBMO|nr:unnamed protein product [Ambrosiozyma monospora]
MNVDYEPDQTVVGDLQDGDADGNVLTEDEPTDDNETEPEADNGQPSSATVAVHNYILDQEASSTPAPEADPEPKPAPNTTTTTTTEPNTNTIRGLVEDIENWTLPDSYFDNPQRLSRETVRMLTEVTTTLLIEGDHLDIRIKDDLDHFMYYARNLYNVLPPEERED